PPRAGPQAYKGFGWALLLDMLAGGLSGAPCSRPEVAPRSANAALFVLLDPARFAGAEHFRAEVTTLAANVRGSRLADPARPIQLPGEPHRHTRGARLRARLPRGEGTWANLTDLAARLGVRSEEC